MSNYKVMVAGVARDLEDDYGLHINKVVGPGASKSTLALDRYALIPGGEVSNIKTQPRTFTIAGTLIGTSRANLHAIRQDLVRLFSDKVTFRYTGTTETKQLEAYYRSGMECNIQVEEPCYWEKVALEFVAPDPFWYEIAQRHEALDIGDSLGFWAIASRLVSTGQWDPLGPPAIGGLSDVRAIAIDGAGRLYVGGDFVNLNGDANQQHIALYDPATTMWSPLGVGLNDMVRAITIGSTGLVYIAGDFDDVRTGGGGTYNRIIMWDPTTLTWSALGSGVNGNVYTLSTGHDGTIYAGGSFTMADGNDAKYVAQWDGAAWSAVDVGLSDQVWASAIGLNGEVYFGGIFTALWGGAPGSYNRIIRWNPTTNTWAHLHVSGINHYVRAIVIGKDGTLYAGGDFTAAGATTCYYVAKWNGADWFPLGSEHLDSLVRSLAISDEGLLYLGGSFLNIGKNPYRRMAIWNGYTYTHLDLDLPTIKVDYVLAIAIGDPPNPAIPRNRDIHIGYNYTNVGTESRAGLVTITNDGNAQTYPTITLARVGGTSARIWRIRNETAGKTLYLNYNLVDGETLTITLSPTKAAARSSYFGKMPNAILRGSDFAGFSLVPGPNSITCFVNVVGAPTITAEMTWHNAYRSFD